jgi:hypothetical protein
MGLRIDYYPTIFQKFKKNSKESNQEPSIVLKMQIEIDRIPVPDRVTSRRINDHSQHPGAQAGNDHKPQ